jgi:hypothetical protein
VWREAVWQGYGLAGAGTSGRPFTGVIALGPVRGAAASLRQVLALPDFTNDTIVIVDDLDEYRSRRGAYHEIFTLLGRARRPALRVAQRADDVLEGRLRRTYYETTGPWPASRSTGSMMLAPGTPAPELGAPADELVTELLRTFAPRLAARVERPAVYLVRDRGHPAWLEL